MQDSASAPRPPLFHLAPNPSPASPPSYRMRAAPCSPTRAAAPDAELRTEAPGHPSGVRECAPGQSLRKQQGVRDLESSKKDSLGGWREKKGCGCV